MPTISLCMIVKNEEAILARCLDTVAHLMDEIIIVDTGSTDATKEIAARYTDKIYDFTWVDDFSAARNFSFSKATMDYIYAPDADEVLDAENQEAFAVLKEALVPEVEIVQMKYHTVTEFDTVLNAELEYRPKLFKRLRTFTWINPVHETVRLDPVVFDSDIVITHMPQSFHGKRDFSIFEKMLAEDIPFTETLIKMYATELMKVGDLQDLMAAAEFVAEIGYIEEYFEGRLYAKALEAKVRHLRADLKGMEKLITLAEESYEEHGYANLFNADFAYEVAALCEEKGKLPEAVHWYRQAAYELEVVLDIHRGGDLALEGILRCIGGLIETSGSEAEREWMPLYVMAREDLESWEMPRE